MENEMMDNVLATVAELRRRLICLPNNGWKNVAIVGPAL